MSPNPLPVHGTEAQFAALRGFFLDAGFTQDAVCRYLGIPSFAKFTFTQTAQRVTADTATTPLDSLLLLFVEGEEAPAEMLERVAGAEKIRLLSELGLIAPFEGDARKWISSVGLYPIRSLHLACDRGAKPVDLAGDFVYPPMVENTQEFLNSLPQIACQRLLDLGTGTGVAALLGAQQYAGHAWAADITSRAAHFAEFNRRLNQLANVTVVRGDLYEAVQGLTFDRIVTHPPYVPAPELKTVFRDGGEDGEQILRRVIEGLPQYLEPGGSFHCQAMASDREGEPLEVRIRKWLGESEPEFDVILLTQDLLDPPAFLGRLLQGNKHNVQELRYFGQLFHRVKLQFWVYGNIRIQRRSEPRPVFTARVQKGPHSGEPELDWLLALHAAAHGSDGLARILDACPEKSPYLHLAVLHCVREGQLAPSEFMLRVNHPFDVESKCTQWIARLVQRCDGKTGARGLFHELKEEGVIDPESEEQDFAEVLRMLLTNGFLQMVPFPIPAPRTART